MNQLYAESHIRNLILMAKSDNYLDQRELAIIMKIGLEKGFTEDEINYFVRDDSYFDLIPPKQLIECFEQLYDLGLVMMADGIIQDNELNYYKKFAEKLGLSNKHANFVTLTIVEGLDNNFGKNTIFQASKKFLQEIEE